jgi:hypothetical protein
LVFLHNERWKEHEAGEDLEVNLDPISKKEIMAIKKIKSGKELGSDNIPPEILKADPNASANITIGLLQ